MSNHIHCFTLLQLLSMHSWWHHQMETFSALLALCAGNSLVSGEFPAQRPVTRNFDIFFDLRLIKRLSKHSRDWWFETLSRPLWRHCDVSPSAGLANLKKLKRHPLWRHQMETFSVFPCEFPLQRPVTRSFDDFYDLRLTKRLSKQS